jgi:hypothetical protein
MVFEWIYLCVVLGSNEEMNGVCSGASIANLPNERPTGGAVEHLQKQQPGLSSADPIL